jgi:hypothetical protein
VCPEKVAQAHLNCFDIGGQLGLLNGLKLVHFEFDTFWGQSESKVGDLFVSENAFVQIDIEVIVLKPGEDLLHYV